MCASASVIFCLCFCFLYFLPLAQACNYRALQVIYYLAGDGSCSKLFFQIHFHDYTSLSENTVWLLFSFHTLFPYLLLSLRSAVDDDAVDVPPAPHHATEEKTFVFFFLAESKPQKKLKLHTNSGVSGERFIFHRVDSEN